MNKYHIIEKDNSMQMPSNSWLTPGLSIHICSARLLIVLSFILLLSFNNPAQWKTQSPIPTHLDVRGVAAPTTQRVFIATEDNSFDNGGALFESNDGGITWVQRNVPFAI